MSPSRPELRMDGEGVDAIELKICGIVQGVGFRPYVYRLARSLGLTGTVLNTGQGVLIRAEGGISSLDAFVAALREEPPPLTRISRIEQRRVAPRPGRRRFLILESRAGAERSALIPPDVATCEECAAELFDNQDRRFGYPFINCTNCGPRFTIIESIPYDRRKTSMKVFSMCEECASEYHDPMDRRFHAQPNACERCGPGLRWLGANGEEMASDDPVGDAARALRDGFVVALRGLGGFQLAVDAASKEAVALLRARKRRASKPFAVMVRDLRTARSACAVSREEEQILLSVERPIVLLQKKKENGLAPNLAPWIGELGLMLPCTPLHHLLLSHQDAPPALVMTSGNKSDEPICTANEEALSRLSGIADYFLIHNREIVTRVDDSVTRVAAGRLRMIRRARGYVPRPVTLPWKLPAILSCGAALKNTFCLARGKEAFLSQHIGDLEGAEALSFFEESIEHLEKVLEIIPDLVVCDLHPDYLSTRYARSLSVPLVAVQHHHAHAAAVMAEHGIGEPVLAVVFDGAGYGPDGTVWGGEILLARLAEFRRLGRLDHLLLPGGDAAAREPWRMGLSALEHILGPEAPDSSVLPQPLGSISGEKRLTIGEMMAKGVNCPPTSSCGRLFDAVSALLGVRLLSDYEGQAAMELESMARRALGSDSRRWWAKGRGREYPVAVRHNGEGYIIGTGRLLRAVVSEHKAGVAADLVALGFHQWLVGSVAGLLKRLSFETGVNRVVLSGGCLQNSLLLEGLFRCLKEEGFSVYSGEEVPVNDGGISLGQAVIGGARNVSCRSHEGC